MEIKAWVLDRIWQSFKLLKNNFLWLFLPFFLYNFVSIVIAWTISKYYTMSSFSWMDDMKGLDLFEFLNNSSIVIWITVWITLYIIYLIFYVVVLLWFLKSLKQVVNWKKISILDNLKYWVINFSNSMKTYWHIFAYIALIPSILFIVWWILFNLPYFISGLDFIKSIWGAIIVLSLIIFIIFAIYRWLKSTFSLYSAVNDDSFTKENFTFSIKITDYNWMRIFWNFLLIWIIISIISSIISWIIWSLIFFGNGWSSIIDLFMSWIFKWWNILIPNMWDIKNIINDYVNNFSILSELISNFIKNIITTISSVFLLIFTYIFFLRLQIESNSSSEELNKKNLEL